MICSLEKIHCHSRVNVLRKSHQIKSNTAYGRRRRPSSSFGLSLIKKNKVNILPEACPGEAKTCDVFIIKRFQYLITWNT